MLFSQGVLAWNTELHRAYPGWQAGTTRVLHMTIYNQNQFEDDTKTSCLSIKHTLKSSILLCSVALTVIIHSEWNVRLSVIKFCVNLCRPEDAG